MIDLISLPKVSVGKIVTFAIMSTFTTIDKSDIQGDPQMMILKRRLYRIYLVFFLRYMVVYSCKLVFCYVYQLI